MSAGFRAAAVVGGLVGLVNGYWDEGERMTRMINYDEYKKCVEIPKRMDLCQGLPYHQMTLPNLLGHESLGEVLTQARHWNMQGRKGDLLDCHKDAKTFLCSLFAPVCLQDPNNTANLIDLLPCHSLCANVRQSCKPRLGHLVPDTIWNGLFNCSRYSVDDGLCVPGHHSPKITRLPSKPKQRPDQPKPPVAPPKTNQCAICSYKPPVDAIEDQFCAPLTKFVITLKRVKFKTVRRRVSRGSKKSFRTYYKLYGKHHYLKYLDKRKGKKKQRLFYLPKKRRCGCDLIDNIDGRTELLITGKFERAGGAPIISVIQKLSKNRPLRRMLRRVKKPSGCAQQRSIDPAKLLNNKNKARGERGRGRRPRKYNTKQRSGGFLNEPSLLNKQNKRGRGRVSRRKQS